MRPLIEDAGIAMSPAWTMTSLPRRRQGLVAENPCVSGTKTDHCGLADHRSNRDVADQHHVLESTCPRDDALPVRRESGSPRRCRSGVGDLLGSLAGAPTTKTESVLRFGPSDLHDHGPGEIGDHGLP